MAINVRLKDAGGQILHPETDWSVVQNRPSFYLINYDNIGYYEYSNYKGEFTKSLACEFTSSTQAAGSVTKYFYLNSNGVWTSFTINHTGAETITYTAVSCLRER